jgi:hypothetical protein
LFITLKSCETGLEALPLAVIAAVALVQDSATGTNTTGQQDATILWSSLILSLLSMGHSFGLKMWSMANEWYGLGKFGEAFVFATLDTTLTLAAYALFLGEEALGDSRFYTIGLAVPVLWLSVLYSQYSWVKHTDEQSYFGFYVFAPFMLLWAQIYMLDHTLMAGNNSPIAYPHVLLRRLVLVVLSVAPLCVSFDSSRCAWLSALLLLHTLYSLHIYSLLFKDYCAYCEKSNTGPCEWIGVEHASEKFDCDPLAWAWEHVFFPFSCHCNIQRSSNHHHQEQQQLHPHNPTDALFSINNPVISAADNANSNTTEANKTEPASSSQVGVEYQQAIAQARASGAAAVRTISMSTASSHHVWTKRGNGSAVGVDTETLRGKEGKLFSFVSHDSSTSPKRKARAVLYHLCVQAFLVAVLLVAAATAAMSMPLGFILHSDDISDGRIPAYIPSAFCGVVAVLMFVWPYACGVLIPSRYGPWTHMKQERLWIESCCSNADENHRTIAHLSQLLGRSQRVLVVHSKHYFDELRCVVELGVCVHRDEAYKLVFLGVDWPSLLRHFVDPRCWHTKLSKSELHQLRTFSCDNASCSDPAERASLLVLIEEQWGSVSAFEQFVHDFLPSIVLVCKKDYFQRQGAAVEGIISRLIGLHKINWAELDKDNVPIAAAKIDRKLFQSILDTKTMTFTQSLVQVARSAEVELSEASVLKRGEAAKAKVDLAGCADVLRNSSTDFACSIHAYAGVVWLVCL